MSGRIAHCDTVLIDCCGRDPIASRSVAIEGRSQTPENPATVNVDGPVGAADGIEKTVAAASASSEGMTGGEGSGEMVSLQNVNSDVGSSDADGETDGEWVWVFVRGMLNSRYPQNSKSLSEVGSGRVARQRSS